MEITLNDYERGELIESAAHQLLYTKNGDAGPVLKEVRDRVDDKIDDMVRAEIRAAIDKVVEERIVPMIDGPWPLTNNYGERTGKTASLREIIVEKLTVPRGDSGYGRRPKTLVEELIENAVTAALNGALGAELKKAQEQIKTAVDDTIKTRLTETLKSALGLRA